MHIVLNPTNQFFGPSGRMERAAMISIKRQGGATLLVALIMLILLTMLAVSAINSSSSSVQMVGNTQYREEAAAVAQQAVEQVVSSDFTALPASSAISVDVNQDGKADYTAYVQVPSCTSSTPMTNAELNVASNPQYATCLTTGQPSTTGIVGPSGVVASTQSYCEKQTWDVSATVADPATGASTTVHQGVFAHVPVGAGGNACPQVNVSGSLSGASGP